MLEVKKLSVAYDKAVLLNDISMSVDEGELVALVGPNGAGKSTLLRAITGLVAWDREILRGTAGGEVTLTGEVTFDGRRIERMRAHNIVKLGLIHCPERRRPFREMTVLDNLRAGAFLSSDKKVFQDDLAKVYTLFPVLEGRAKQISGTLSGGEQQMLAVGRALMSGPKLLMIDEPSTGLAPMLRREVFTKIAEIRKLGVTVLLVEQEVSTVFKMSSRNYVLSSGAIVAQGGAEQLLADEIVRRTYLGL
ncbi:MAG: ABC transporter ATP-binding protein [Proteobacteria bacterium]|nr:ABC transporter ATP-binding protein [Pseudomonadota bacterium]MBU1741600.1 ABC transporter ATP-binding protein [Pseudomonadota bacterium]